jgi:hypothetical protein
MNADTRTISTLQPSQEATDLAWKGLYKVGGVAASVVVLLYLLDTAISFGGGDTRPGALAATEWFTLFATNGLLALRTLGFLNVVSVTVGSLLYVALFAAHRWTNAVYAGLALIVYLLGTAIYVSNNPAVPMAALSAEFGAATSENQRTLLAAAGEAILAGGEDFTPGGFIGLFLTEMGGLGMALIMLRAKVFSRAAASVGILGLGLLCIFTIWSTFIPVGYPVAMLLALVGGLSIIGWYILVAQRLFQLGG